MNKIWRIKKSGNIEKVQHLAKVLNVNEKVANLLVQRGIESFEQARIFFRPDLKDLHDPFLMKDMHKAVERLSKAINNNERILIYGDYDVDGITAISLVYNYLVNYNKNIDYYVPDRYTEGYGISYMGVDYAVDNNFTLMIALDCGIKEVDKVNYAKKKGLDVIICDHHNPGETIPDAVAILDPKQIECQYPYSELSGCGVAFKFLQAYSITNNISFDYLKEHLDLVVVSIASDIVPITGENRILAYYGLQKLNYEPCSGLKSIIDITGIDNKEIQINDIVFKIGPRINAAGRIDSAKKSVDLLICKNKESVEKIAIKINSINTDRKELDQEITEEAINIIDNCEIKKNAASTVLYSDKWHKGVLGIVASRLIEKYYRPTVVFAKSNGKLTGSARSIPGFDLYAAIDYCSDLLEHFGGHMFAAGLTLKYENIEEFSKKFEKYVDDKLPQELRSPAIDIDMELQLKDITPQFFRIIKQFAPFGPQNMTPIFCTKNLYDNGSIRKVGKGHEHLKLKLVQNLGDNRCIEAIGFNFADYYDKIKDFTPFDLCYQISENKFMNKSQIQIFIKEIKV